MRRKSKRSIYFRECGGIQGARAADRGDDVREPRRVAPIDREAVASLRTADYLEQFSEHLLSQYKIATLIEMYVVNAVY